MAINYKQLTFDLVEEVKPRYLESGRTLETNGYGNKLSPDDKEFHDWYRFVLSYPAHLVRHYINEFNLGSNQLILDPFCGTGTTLVEAKRNGFEAIGLEANPVAHFASQVKVDWNINPDKLLAIAHDVAGQALKILKMQGIDDTRALDVNDIQVGLNSLDAEKNEILLSNSISPIPLHKALVLLDTLSGYDDEDCYQHLRLAYAKALVFSFSNLHFGPEVGVGKIMMDTPVVSAWFAEVSNIAKDIRKVYGNDYPTVRAILGDARNLGRMLESNSIDAVITSPPYPNEKDYTRTTRLESVLLGFINNKEDLRNLKKNLIRSNTRGVYVVDDDDKLVAGFPSVQAISNEIERRRIELGKTSGFERLYSRVTKLYFGGMARHLLDLQPKLRKGAQLAYVVGDQASYLRVMIPTGQLLAEIAESIGYEVVRLDLFRKRFATATKQELREEVVILRWKGKS